MVPQPPSQSTGLRRKCHGATSSPATRTGQHKADQILQIKTCAVPVDGRVTGDVHAHYLAKPLILEISGKDGTHSADKAKLVIPEHSEGNTKTLPKLYAL